VKEEEEWKEKPGEGVSGFVEVLLDRDDDDSERDSRLISLEEPSSGLLLLSSFSAFVAKLHPKTNIAVDKKIALIKTNHQKRLFDSVLCCFVFIKRIL
jgi:hypothetical protein